MKKPTQHPSTKPTTQPKQPQQLEVTDLARVRGGVMKKLNEMSMD